MHDFCPIKRIDHLEFFVGNARQAAVFYETCFGFHRTAYRGLETGSRDTASYVLEQGDIRFVLTSPLGPDHTTAQFIRQHGDGVGVIALEVPDAAAAFRETTSRGAEPAVAPEESRDEKGVLRTSAIHLYGDTLMKFVERDDYVGTFAPGFRPVSAGSSGNGSTALTAGGSTALTASGSTALTASGSTALTASGSTALTASGVLKVIDHIVGNVELGAMEKWVRFFAETMGFTQLIHFDDKTITTEYSALMSKVMQDGTGRVKFPINEPATGKRKSQIQEYLDYYRGPGVQHIACATDDIVATVRHLRENGVEFIRVPPAYYEDLDRRIGTIDERLDDLAELGILADRDDEGYLLQIFTQPVQDRPTLFFEVIERHGCRGFGEGNFKSLFEAIEREQARRGNLV